MAGMGPPPNPNARRRNARPEMRRLPASGRRGDPPDWPLGRTTKAERELWLQLWASPQAVAWESLGWARSVARYVVCVVKAEKRDAPVALLAEARQFEDRLGLNPLAMRRLMWEIVDLGATTETETDADSDRPADLDRYRDRLGA